VLTIYIGDDKTDEDAFKVIVINRLLWCHACFSNSLFVDSLNTDTKRLLQVLRESNKGCGILVSPAPKESNAVYSLRDPSEVILFILIYFVCFFFFHWTASESDRWNFCDVIIQPMLYLQVMEFLTSLAEWKSSIQACWKALQIV